ncbi:DnaT-like ssDNA-binding protein [Serratia fonticola]|uniref:DnaT-like ssDNA-binding protein n=1 Tax=Serratia fonticola TaxID=47917 RepID=UPI0034C6360B
MLDTDFHSDGFNSYASLAECRDYATARGLTLPGDDGELSTLMLQAMDYLEGKSWKGFPAVLGQNLAWPRSNVVRDYHVLPRNTIPKQVKQAQCRLAFEAQDTDLQPTADSGSEVLSEAVSGAVSVTYAEGTRKAQPSFAAVDALLRGFCVGSGQVAVKRG